MSTSSPIDARGPRFNATITSVLLVLTLATAPFGIGVWVLVVQTLLFASGALLGVQRTPIAWVFRHVVRPRLGPATDWEDPRPPRFAQGIGLAFAVIGLVGFTFGPTWLGYVAVGFALVAAFLNASIQFCLGCQVYGVCKLPQSRDITSNSTTHTKEEAIA